MLYSSAYIMQNLLLFAELGPCLLRQTQLMTTLCELLHGFARGFCSRKASAATQQAPGGATADAPAVPTGKQPLDNATEPPAAAMDAAAEASAAAAADDVMARLDAEADAALARDFADLWDGALKDVQASVGEDIDMSWLGAPGGGLGVRSLSEGEAPKATSARSEAGMQHGTDDEMEREGAAAQAGPLWASLTLGVRSILRAVTAVRSGDYASGACFERNLPKSERIPCCHSVLRLLAGAFR